MKRLAMFVFAAAVAASFLLISKLTYTLTLAAEQGEPGKGLFTVAGRTRCIPGNKAIIAPTVLHPVEHIHVALGDRVKKGDKLVELDADEPKADVRAKLANFEAMEIILKDAVRHLQVCEGIRKEGVLPEHRHHEADTAAKKAAADVRQAKALYEAAKFELEHYTVEAPIDGVVNTLDVNLGMVSRPGTTTWGEILNLSEIDVSCNLTLAQVEQLEAGQKSKLLLIHGLRYYGQEAEIFNKETGAKYATGFVVFINLQADPSGTVQALVRLDNAGYKLRCEVPVQVRFTGARNDDAIRAQEKRIEHRDKERKAEEKK